MLKNSTQLTSVIDGKEGHFLLDPNIPIHAIKEMLFEFLTHVGNVEAQIKAQQAAQQPVAEPGSIPVMDTPPVPELSEKIVPLEQPQAE